MSREFGTYGRGMLREIWWRKLKDRGLLCDVGVNERIILKLILNKYAWVHLAQGMKKWRAFMKTVMNLRVS